MLFCYKITNEFPKILKTNITQIINITHISLQNSISNNKINCFIEYKNESFKICSLQKNYKEEYSCLISFKINKNDEFKLKIDGDKNTKVNFIGYINDDVEDEIKLLDENINEGKKIKKEKNNKKELIDSDDDDILSENENVEIEELLNKKRKENPQDIKPIILNNLNQNNTKNYNLNKSQKKNKNLKNKKNNNKNNTILNK